jgi:hypothetical protein
MEPPAGLVNVGNTCYFGSVLQALASSPSFVEYCSSLNAAVDDCSLPHAEADAGATRVPSASWWRSLGQLAAAVLSFLSGEPWPRRQGSPAPAAPAR